MNDHPPINGTGHGPPPAEITPQINLAAMVDQVAHQIAHGKFGDVSACAIFLRGEKSNAILALPIEAPEDTARQFERGAAWLRTGELPT